MQISDWRRDHTWRPNTHGEKEEDDSGPETYLAQRYVDAPYLVRAQGHWLLGFIGLVCALVSYLC